MEWNVWYRPENAEGAGFSRDQDKGTLTIDGDKITYEGKKTPHISFDNIRSVGKQRISLWLMWASIEYEENGEVKRANFGDRCGPLPEETDQEDGDLPLKAIKESVRSEALN